MLVGFEERRAAVRHESMVAVCRQGRRKRVGHTRIVIDVQHGILVTERHRESVEHARDEVARATIMCRPLEARSFSQRRAFACFPRNKSGTWHRRRN